MCAHYYNTPTSLSMHIVHIYNHGVNSVKKKFNFVYFIIYCSKVLELLI
jgi:hypothetical protein